jgi:hypothetical protein
MSDTFNGYHVWLGIPPGEQPPNHYRLLGITVFESDLDVIDHAADRQMAHVRTFQSGRHGALSQQILNELAAARLCLLNPDRKSAYDSQLRDKIGGTPVAASKAIPVGKPLPVARPVAAAPPRAAPATVTQPPPKVFAAKPVEVEQAPLDIDPSDVGTTLVRLKRRRRKGDSTWQSAAIAGTLAGVAVIICVVLYYVLRDLDWKKMLEDTPFAPSTATEAGLLPGTSTAYPNSAPPAPSPGRS